MFGNHTLTGGIIGRGVGAHNFGEVGGPLPGAKPGKGGGGGPNVPFIAGNGGGGGAGSAPGIGGGGGATEDVPSIVKGGGGGGGTKDVPGIGGGGGGGGPEVVPGMGGGGGGGPEVVPGMGGGGGGGPKVIPGMGGGGGGGPEVVPGMGGGDGGGTIVLVISVSGIEGQSAIVNAPGIGDGGVVFVDRSVLGAGDELAIGEANVDKFTGQLLYSTLSFVLVLKHLSSASFIVVCVLTSIFSFNNSNLQFLHFKFKSHNLLLSFLKLSLVSFLLLSQIRSFDRLLYL